MDLGKHRFGSRDPAPKIWPKGFRVMCVLAHISYFRTAR